MKKIQNLTRVSILYFLKTVSLVFIVLFVFSCSNDDDTIMPEQQEEEEVEDTPPEVVLEKFDLTSEKSSVKPLEFVILESDEINFNEEYYVATIDEVDVELVKIEDNRLMFSVPELSVGQATLELLIGDKIGELSFTVSENVVPDMETLIETELTTPLNDFNTDITDLLAEASIPFEAKEQLTSAKNMIEEYMTKLNSLTAEERMNVARFYSVNPLLTTDVFNLSSNGAKASVKYSSFRRSTIRLVAVIATVLTAAEIIAPLVINGLAILGTFLGVSTVAAGIIVTAIGAAAIIHAEHNRKLNDAFLPFQNLLKDDSGNFISNNSSSKQEKSSAYKIYNNTFYVFNVVSRDRLLNSSDINHPNPQISGLVSKINLLDTKWDAFREGVNSILTTAGNWLSTWFSSSSVSFEPITYDFKSLPGSTPLIETQGNSEFISITGFPSDIQMDFSVASSNTINLKLSTDTSTLPRTVSGKIKYDDGYFITEDEFSITINKDAKAQDIEIVSGNDQTGKQGDQLSEPLVVVVKDDQGNTVSNQEVVFKVTDGEGSLSQENVFTDSNGNAQTNWTLGDSVDSQTVEASISDDEGNIIESISFSATATNECTDNEPPTITGISYTCKKRPDDSADEITFFVNIDFTNGIEDANFEDYTIVVTNANGGGYDERLISGTMSSGRFEVAVAGLMPEYWTCSSFGGSSMVLKEGVVYMIDPCGNESNRINYRAIIYSVD